jgi:hypothetical protein
MKKTGLLIQDNIVVINSDSTDTVTTTFQVMRLDYILYMVIVNYFYCFKKYSLSELCTVRNLYSIKCLTSQSFNCGL